MVSNQFKTNKQNTHFTFEIANKTLGKTKLPKRFSITEYMLTPARA